MQTGTPLVSIIIPCFNAQDLIEDAITSALAQDYANIEVLVIDDGSTDNTVGVASRFKDRIRLITGQNEGACVARNKGLKNARGDWIQFLDADDLLRPDKLAKMMPIIMRSQNDTIVASGRYVVGEKTGERNETILLESSSDALIDALKQVICTPGPIFPRSALLKLGGYREDLCCCQDYELNLRFAMSGWKFEFIGDPLFTVRRQPRSISADISRVFRVQVQIWDETVNALANVDQLTPI